MAFVHAEHGLAIGEEVRRRGIRKQYYLETRGDVLLRNREVFRLWRDLGLLYMFIGLDPGSRRSRAIDDATERFVDETRMGA